MFEEMGTICGVAEVRALDDYEKTIIIIGFRRAARPHNRRNKYDVTSVSDKQEPKSAPLWVSTSDRRRNRALSRKKKGLWPTAE